MTETSTNQDTPATTTPRVAEIFNEHQRLVHRRTDRMFAGLMALQWLAGVAAALWVSPKTWAGADESHASARLGSAVSGRRDQFSSHLAGADSSRSTPPPATRSRSARC